MYLSTMAEWLDWIASIHIQEIALGLDRVEQVAERLGVLTPKCPVIIVGGTNGKGSTVAGLEAIYREQGYKVGAFTSPYLHKPNEQVRMNGMMASDAMFCSAFAAIENSRAEIPLTPFEFFTLAAFIIFHQHDLDVLILEVGLGGRLDAVNIMNADVAIVTSIGIDHVDWLGSTREDIAFEKAGIFRTNKPAVCGDFDPPSTLLQAAKEKSAPLYCQGRDFYYEKLATSWNWETKETSYPQLPIPALAIQNMSTVLMAVTLLQQSLPVSRQAITTALSEVNLPGRIQIIPGAVTRIYDVSHNPAAIAFLLQRLKQMPFQGKTLGVFSMLADKDILASINAIGSMIDAWYAAPLLIKRGASVETLQQAFKEAEVKGVQYFENIQAAYAKASSDAKSGDRLLIFGSFHTVAACLVE